MKISAANPPPSALRVDHGGVHHLLRAPLVRRLDAVQEGGRGLVAHGPVHRSRLVARGSLSKVLFIKDRFAKVLIESSCENDYSPSFPIHSSL